MGEKATILAVGPRMLALAMEVADRNDGVGVINARTVKPICEKTLLEIAKTTVITLEENSLIGGFGSIVSDFYLKRDLAVKRLSFGIKDEFIEHGSIKNQLEYNGLTAENIEKFIREL